MKQLPRSSSLASCLFLVFVLATAPRFGVHAIAAAKTYNHSLDHDLGEAIAAGKAEQVRALLKKGADPNAKTADETATPMLILAAATDSTAGIAGQLVEAGASLEAVNVQGDTALVAAAMKGNVNVVNLLLKSGAKIETNSDRGLTPLMFAAATGHTEVVRSLLKAGAKVNAVANNGNTALMLGNTKTAAGAGNLEIAKLLVDAGADVSVETADKKDAIQLAWDSGLNDVAPYLTTIRDRDASLLSAADNGDWKAIKAALAAGANPRYQTTLYEGEGDEEGTRTNAALLLISTAPGFDAAIAAQILARSDLDLREQVGELVEDTALTKAVRASDFIMAHLLIKAGANPNLLSNLSRKTPLMMAAEDGNLDLVKELVAAGADKDAKNNTGQTALGLAQAAGRKEIVAFLQGHPDIAPAPMDGADEDLPDLHDLVVPGTPKPEFKQ